jgi:sugar phosphate isomerase/epimerase
MHRRTFLANLGLAAAATQLGCARGVTLGGTTDRRRLRHVGIQLYTLRDDARRDLERSLAEIAAIGYKDVELLASMNNFGMPPARLRQILDRVGLRAPSTHVGARELTSLDRQLDDAQTLGHQYIILASLPDVGRLTLDDYRLWADRLSEAGRRARERGIWVGFHDEPYDFTPINGQIPYDVLVERTDPSLVRLQLDTGNAAMGGRDPLEYMRRYGNRYWLFHIKDAPRLGSPTDTELGRGVVDFRRLFQMIDDIDSKFLYVEQETYPGAPIASVRRDYTYISRLEF